MFGIKYLIEETNTNIFIEMDADFSHDNSEKSELFKLNNYDLLISSRYLKESVIKNWPTSREFSHFLPINLLVSF